MSPCVLGLGFTIMYLKYWSLVQTWQSLSYLVHFCHMRKWWHKGDLMGYYPFSPYINPVTSWGLLIYFQAVVYVSFNHHWHLKWVELKQNQQKWVILSYLNLIRPSCDLEMTLLWPWGNTPVKRNPKPCHRVNWGLGFIQCIWSKPNGQWSKHAIVELFGLFLPYKKGVT